MDVRFCFQNFHFGKAKGSREIMVPTNNFESCET